MSRGEQMREPGLGEAGRRQIERLCARLVEGEIGHARHCLTGQRRHRRVSDRGNGVGRRDHGDDLELDHVGPARRPLRQERRVLALHDLVAAAQILRDPARSHSASPPAPSDPARESAGTRAPDPRRESARRSCIACSLQALAFARSAAIDAPCQIIPRRSARRLHGLAARQGPLALRLGPLRAPAPPAQSLLGGGIGRGAKPPSEWSSPPGGGGRPGRRGPPRTRRRPHRPAPRRSGGASPCWAGPRRAAPSASRRPWARGRRPPCAR